MVLFSSTVRDTCTAVQAVQQFFTTAVYTQVGTLVPVEPESFNDWGGRGCRKFVPVLKGDGTKIAPPGDIFDQPPGEMS